jgi:nitric oxide reductase subunit B
MCFSLACSANNASHRRSLHVRPKKSWWLLGTTIVVSFFILGFFGREVYRQAPPIPERVVSTDGKLLMTKDDILTGQQVWQSTGGQQLGSIWRHGAYMAPDWSADWLAWIEA